jgi:outer membrane assembly lipoprotein YfiO
MKKLICACLLLAVAACSSAPKGERIGTVSDLYNEGLDALLAKEYAEAVFAFEELQRQHPYSGWATRSKLMVAYSHFKNGDYDRAVTEANQFIRLHPGHANLPYMFYLRGLSHYYRISDVRRDQGHTEQALAAFEEVVNRYPNSVYARDAAFKITLCRDHLAGKEMDVGVTIRGKTVF